MKRENRIEGYARRIRLVKEEGQLKRGGATGTM
jgi:hypothetical protein